MSNAHNTGSPKKKKKNLKRNIKLYVISLNFINVYIYILFI